MASAATASSAVAAGDAAFVRGRPDAALRHYSAAVAAGEPHALARRAAAALQLERYAAALQDAADAVAADGEDASLLFVQA